MVVDNPPAQCPKCGAGLGAGFTSAASLRFLKPDRFAPMGFVVEDLSGGGLLSFLPTLDKCCLAWICRKCELYIVDYSKVYSCDKANALAVQNAGGSNPGTR